MLNQHQKAERFQALHQGPLFIMPNPWDAGSARLLAGFGFQAPSRRPSANASPALVVARAWTPKPANNRALPASQGFGMMNSWPW